MTSQIHHLDRNDLRLVAGEGKGNVRSQQMLPELSNPSVDVSVFP